jgi:hypothetical protein
MTIPDDAVGPLADAAKELIPKVYEDGVQSSLQEIGRTLHGVVRTVLRPVNALVWSVDQASEWIEQKVTQRLSARGVSMSDVSSPSPQLLYGVIRGVQATGSDADHNLRDMYVNLLATAMDVSTSRIAHPAFSEILHQILPDEARIIQLLGGNGGFAIVSLSAHAWRLDRNVDPPRESSFKESVISLGVEAECNCPEMVMSYIDNLRRLGLVIDEHHTWQEHAKDFPPTPVSDSEAALRTWVFAYRYPAIAQITHAFTQFILQHVDSSRLDVRLMRLTSLGSQFIQACGPE